MDLDIKNMTSAHMNRDSETPYSDSIYYLVYILTMKQHAVIVSEYGS